ncbi:hypothetical protein [Mesomycoplasma molare]|uniref:CopG family transcriptional regulator n=1 Tax=Mesomycoplasma molare TaxID=171288 RepID=A0ABY5TVD3_9BACT|nr:hypothetical protein [Mesomycoplasma molare]UWD33976.1 hypothetical protein NX772_02610 [Mesomycoplasma molare]
MLKKIITLTKEEWDQIKDAAEERGLSFGNFLKESVFIRMREDKKLDLAGYLNKYAPFVDEQEQAEYDEMIANGELDLDDMSDASELTLADLESDDEI